MSKSKQDVATCSAAETGRRSAFTQSARRSALTTDPQPSRENLEAVSGWDVSVSSVVAVLAAVRQLLARKGWRAGQPYAWRKSAEDFTHPEDFPYTLVEALQAVPASQREYSAARDILDGLTDSNIVRWNATRARTEQDVFDLIAKAIQKVRGETPRRPQRGGWRISTGGSTHEGR